MLNAYLIQKNGEGFADILTMEDQEIAFVDWLEQNDLDYDETLHEDKEGNTFVKVEEDIYTIVEL